MHDIVRLTYTMAVAISLSLAFNIDTTTPHILPTEQRNIFEDKLLQLISGKKNGKHTVPEQLNRSEEIFTSDLKQTHQCLIVPDISRTDTTIPVKHFGLSIAEDSSRSKFTVCSPNVAHACNSNLNNTCYNMTYRLQKISIKSAFQECIKMKVDLVFLFDGSESLTGAEFHKNKEFIVDAMKSIKNISIKFAAVQFSTIYRKVFDFNDYQAGCALDKLMIEPHMRGLTNTHRALTFVLEEILENPDAGASPDSIKVVVLITDGDPSDINIGRIIKRYDDKNIIRFVIGVKDAKLDKFRAMASEPKDKNAFKIENYDGLTGVQETFKNKILNMEGPKVAWTGQTAGEMSFYKLCSPNVAHGRNEKSYLNSTCYTMTDHLQHLSSFKSALQVCTKKKVDLVFLFDGSESLTGAEFHKNKEFIVDAMNRFKNTSIKFAAVQFSTIHRKVFDFNDYQAGRALDKLMIEPHMRGLTNTHRALTFVLEEILENPDAGASPDSIKVVVVITDGDPSDVNIGRIIKRYNYRNIIRFVIGVKDVKLDTFRAMASEPKDKYAFKIGNYDGLTGVLENCKNKILNMGGPEVARTGQIPDEMSFYKLCSPNVAHGYNEKSYLNSACYTITDHLQQLSSFKPALQECTENKVDLVFLFDGSESMTGAEFHKNKELIVDIMKSLKNTSIKFAAVQFSTEHRKVFDFNDYQAGRALDKLMREPHMRGLTNTHRALTFVLREILENPDAGASPDSIKVVVLITDGDPSDINIGRIIKRYNYKNIIRFVIGVKDAKLDTFRAMASEPKDKNSFKIENYDGLTGVRENFKNKILNMEGPKVARTGQITAEMSFYKLCSPNVAHGCDETSYLNSVCYTMTDHLQQMSSFKHALQVCTKKKVDLVFLFDGSESLTGAEFHKNKEFIVDVMKTFKSTSIKFAAVQFSTERRKVFDFNDYQAGRAFENLMREPHMRGLTNTHRALKFVLEKILENRDAGASPGSTKVVVVITDGDPSDTNKKKIIERYDDKNIIRFVIGIKDATLDKFRAMASEPKDKTAFKIENYDGLIGILENFKSKNFNIEGQITDDMSRGGFSAVFYKDTLILGSLGSNSWRGSLQEYQEQKLNGSYLGYSVSVGVKNSATLYFTGAPRFEHTGQVVLFRHDGKNWTTAQRVTGDQIGSYFGAELCSVDVNSDGNTDFLLVGAPRFHQPQEEREGQIYVYKLTDEIQLKHVLNVTASSMGRFGTTISSLADLNGDCLRDVAVGAPFEDDNRGAVYIYLGDRHTGIRSTFSQRIMGRTIKPDLRFFGRAINRDIDLGADGLPGILIGSQNTAVILRSRPVFNVTAYLSFEHQEINTNKLDCLGTTDENVPVGILKACFETFETTNSRADDSAGQMRSGLNISYTLDVDPMRQTNRGFFIKTDLKTRNVTTTIRLTEGYTCNSYQIYLPKCVDDTVTPLSIRLDFVQVDSESTGGVLNVDSKKQVVVEIPFHK